MPDTYSIIVTGGTGTAGLGAIHEAIRDARISKIFVLARRPISIEHEKVEYIEHKDFTKYDKALLDRLRGCKACLWDLGIVLGDAELVVRDFVNAALEAFTTLHEAFIFCYLSGQLMSWSSKAGGGMAIRIATEQRVQRMGGMVFRSGRILADPPKPDRSLTVRLVDGAFDALFSVVFTTRRHKASALAAVMIDVGIRGPKAEFADKGGPEESNLYGVFDIVEHAKRLDKVLV